ncbi:D-alanyl-D-alanine carboxypeptidase family protein [Capilliphycus salinus ALCB114379]|uniref:M15 family metallopeptidase n=1 Tax=Capilliphycus salinus TaxID=2768948 RepID=UPI0039A65D79
MNNASLPENTQPVSEMVVEDIPEAIRDPHETQPAAKGSQRKWPFWKLFGLGIAAFGLAIFLNSQFGLLLRQKPTPAAQETPSVVSSQPPSSPNATANLENNPSTPTANSTEDPSENLLGHLPYEEASPDQLQSITADGSIKLRIAAAQAYLEMAEAARRDNIRLVPISGFRTITDQEYLFFEVKAQRGQNASKRAEVSAPPGYSEHHTGYAIDIGDADYPDTHLEVTFEKTTAFQWLSENAAFYSFELSFPQDNPQGVSYEPWHWRYVGDRHSLETFYKAQSLPENSDDIPEAEIEP